MKILKTKKYAQQQITYQQIFTDSLNENNGDTRKAAEEVLDLATNGTWAVWDQNKIDNSIEKILEQFAPSTDFDKCDICGKLKHWEDFKYNGECNDCAETEEESQRIGRDFMETGEYLNYPELGDR